SLPATGQSNKFKRLYSNSSGGEWAISALNFDDSTFLLNGFCITDSARGLWMMKIGSDGTLLDSRVFAKPLTIFLGASAGSLVRVGDHYYVGAGDQYPNPNIPNEYYGMPYIVKLESNGLDTVWTKRLINDTNKYYLPASFKVTGDHHLLLAGAVCKPYVTPGIFDYFLIKADTNGNVLWEKKYGVNNLDERCNNVEVDYDSTILLTGMKYSSGKYRPWIIRVDKNGNNPQYKQYTIPSMQHAGVDVKKRAGGGYYMTGFTDSLLQAGDDPETMYLGRLDSNLNIVWRTFVNSPYLTQIWDFFERENGSVVFCGDRKDSVTGKPYGYIAKADSNGNLLWWQTYHEYPQRVNYLSCVRPTADGGIIACGSAFDTLTGQNQNAWVIKTDSMGCALTQCVTSVADAHPFAEKVMIYPNPAKDRFRLSCGTGTLITVYTLSGSRVYQQVINTGNEEISTEGWVRGIYLVRLQMKGGGFITERLLVE
ncbi:MAG: T9SS type A sorting domain-containing protein, partial [Sphingobacteriales bacterium]